MRLKSIHELTTSRQLIVMVFFIGVSLITLLASFVYIVFVSIVTVCISLQFVTVCMGLHELFVLHDNFGKSYNY